MHFFTKKEDHETGFAVASSLLVLFSAMVDPRFSAGVALTLLVGLLGYRTLANGRVEEHVCLTGFLAAFGTTAYVALVATFMRNAERLFGQGPSLVGMAAFLMLFVLSALVTGSLMLGGPVWLYLEGKKGLSLRLLGWNAAWLALCIVVALLLLALRA